MSSEQGAESQKQEEAQLASDTGGAEEKASETGEDRVGMVTSKGAGLNPNAKVWQEFPVAPSEASFSQWPQAAPSPDVPEGFSGAHPTGCKDYSMGLASLADGGTPAAPESVVNGMDPPDRDFPLYEPMTGLAVESELLDEQPISAENLRESLKKQLEFCFSRENLSKDLYLMSQMDSDQFVPIWTIASMEGIKVLTTDMDLILEVLRESPMVQVDEKGEKVRPNHKRCIIILREVPEATPVEEVKALFKNDDCPKVISVEFAHNNNWYITFQSDTDAQQAYRYLREEVKTFQGKPIMARIKAINTFFAKNGYRSVDSSMYPQQSQSLSQYSSPLFMQQVYSPQQQYPLYGIVPPTWPHSPTPYFETPLAPFPNSGFVNGFNSPGNYKTGTNSLNIGRPFHRNRNHVKPHPRASDGTSPSVTPVPLVDGLSGSRSGGSETSPSFSARDPHLSPAEPNGDGSMAGRGRRGSYRGMRRRRDDERTTRPTPLGEIKVQPPKFDLAASNFPPLPGCVVSTQGEPVLENRMSDVVRGLSREKPDVCKDSSPSTTSAQEEDVCVPSPTQSVCKPTPPPFEPPVSSVVHQEKKVDKTEPHVQRAVSPVTTPPLAPLPATISQPALTSKPPRSQANSITSIPSSTPALEPRKLSYAEVCQRPPKDPPPAAVQPLRELRVNKADEPISSNPGPGTRRDKTPERPADAKSAESRPPYRSNGPPRAGGAGLKFGAQQKRPALARCSSPQGGLRRSGKEQNIPPRSPK